MATANEFVPHVRREVFQRLKGLEIDQCPFFNLPEKRRTWWALTAEEMKECRWLRPELVAQIEFREWTPDGHLRHCSFVALRTTRWQMAWCTMRSPDRLFGRRQHGRRNRKADLLGRFQVYDQLKLRWLLDGKICWGLLL